ncbi:hypothetical protein [Curtobacterium sp. VKM Ac-1376]|uniref:hypothetical protein n=1 Tax=Curtobacterium sp. VKM Ac-1376 TaxID=123312 RepID=UPI00188CEEA9|nr:hypothetical protein [Curtobacterium sp. VKM Ac-1376]MBF4615841.1 hypothetical protein [Curtobacterium sp. VKM Ac-1376]
MGNLIVDVAAMNAASKTITRISAALNGEVGSAGMSADFGSDAVAAAHSDSSASHERSLRAIAEMTDTIGGWVRTAAEEFSRRDADLASAIE